MFVSAYYVHTLSKYACRLAVLKEIPKVCRFRRQYSGSVGCTVEPMPDHLTNSWRRAEIPLPAVGTNGVARAGRRSRY